jgi:tRNA-Thr(GGU) m(6)t(6)A37 methyltransferase TsaA
MKVIAHIITDMPAKFGVPRQSGLVKELMGRIIFEEKYRVKEAVKGLEDFTYLWLIWQFSGVEIPTEEDEYWSPSVKPPRLGGKKKMGVFATRSPFRPNRIGLSSVKLEKIEYDKELGPVIYVSGIDLMDGTPIYDIKPYLAYVDSHPEAGNGFAEDTADYELQVVFPQQWIVMIPEEKRAGIMGVLAQDPRPAYHDFPERIYGVEYAGFDVRFTVEHGVLTVCEVESLHGKRFREISSDNP